MSKARYPLRIVIVEDDDDLLGSLQEMLTRAGYEVDPARDAASGLDLVDRADLLLTDVQLPDGDGLDLLRQAKQRHPRLQVVVMTGYGSIPSAVDAMRWGARTYLTKPFEPHELLLHLGEVEETVLLRRAAARAGRGDLVGSSAAMRKVYAEIDAAALTDASLLIEGETGTGKELAARAVHELSARNRSPFVAVNLGAVPHDLVESELFGHERGAFTGALRKKRGRMALARGGTLLLDELDSLPLHLQPKLLRALETGEIWPIGTEQGDRLEVRIIAATNTDLQEAVRQNQFREDLYYRLNVLNIRMPPLRDRPGDIPLITTALVERIISAGSSGDPPVQIPEISSGALASLLTQPFRGNVRELRNMIERALARGTAQRRIPPRLEAEDFDLDTTLLPSLPFKEARARAADEWTRRTIRSALGATDGNVTRAAELLQMNTSALFRLIKRYHLRSRR